MFVYDYIINIGFINVEKRVVIISGIDENGVFI